MKTLITTLLGIALTMNVAQATESEVEVLANELEQVPVVEMELDILAELEQLELQVIEQTEMESTVGTGRHGRKGKKHRR
ncbi:MAG: hypothetical protein IMF12_00020 [Proteobacteria bacterium]|nr:hypothetical protein [Pseudomonadota bacterium]